MTKYFNWDSRDSFGGWRNKIIFRHDDELYYLFCHAREEVRVRSQRATRVGGGGGGCGGGVVRVCWV